MFVAADPMGNFSYVGNLNPYGEAHVRVQSNAVFEAHLADGTTQLVWTGDQWGSARSGAKGSDTQFWVPLAFDDADVDVGGGGVQRVPVPRPVKWVDEFELALAPASRPASEAGAEACSTEDGKAPAGAS